MSRGRIARRAVLHVVVALGAFVILSPLLWALGASLKPQPEAYSPALWPSRPTLGNFVALFSQPGAPMGRWLFNSLFVAGLEGLLVLALCVPAAYGYARLEFCGRDLLFAILLGALLLPDIIFLVPNFLIIQQLGLVNSDAAVLLPGLGSAFGAFGIFFLRQFFLGVPAEIEEAMLIDGANRWRIVWSLVVPLSKGALATLFVLTFLHSWNDYTWPNVVLTSTDNLTLPLGLSQSLGAYGSTGVVMAAAVVASVPVIVIFAALQRFIIQSVASAALKG